MTTPLMLTELNALDEAAFVQRLGGIFEHSPWVTQQAFGKRPFASVEALHACMVAAIETAGTEAQLRLIRAHPELAGKAAVRGELTQDSTREQSGAGLNQCSPEEFATLQQLNADYNAKFGFPFIVAVRGHTRHSIIALFQQRLNNTVDAERQECLEQIYRIGQFRLSDAIKA
jgi:2-oxo-4-hydroxy-4-carboxy-5-ureidoimidazoline decarboxylase